MVFSPNRSRAGVSVPFEILIADYTNPQHCQDLIHLLDEYARDPMGGG